MMVGWCSDAAQAEPRRVVTIFVDFLFLFFVLPLASHQLHIFKLARADGPDGIFCGFCFGGGGAKSF